MESDNDATGALVLLALTAIVIASGSFGGLATRSKSDLEIDAKDADDDLGL